MLIRDKTEAMRKISMEGVFLKRKWDNECYIFVEKVFQNLQICLLKLTVLVFRNLL